MKKNFLFLSIIFCIFISFTVCDADYIPTVEDKRAEVKPECQDYTNQQRSMMRKEQKHANQNNKKYDYNAGDFIMCEVRRNPPDVKKSEAVKKGSGGGNKISSLTSGCPCPDGIQVKTDGCQITFTCSIGGDQNASVSVTTPCPQIMGSDPKYPLVKMLSGTLIEWNKSGVEKSNLDGYLSWGAPGGTGGPGNFYGAEVFDGINYTVVLSSIDLGQNVKFSTDRANAKKNAKNPLDRSNFIFNLVGGSPYVEVLNQHDIYDAYKARNKYVQAYTVLAGKGYHERPWTSYDKFIDAMCDMSSSKSRCKKELAYYGHRDTEMQGNLYLGNGDMSIIGLYSEVSSHGCHGATVINDKGEPAFGITIKSTWCFYIHAEWGMYYVWELDEVRSVRDCCENKVNEQTCDDEFNCTTTEVCKAWHEYWLVKESWHAKGSGNSSSGDCGVCQTATGYIDEKGKMTTEPLAISFYQSQPLLITGQ